MKINCYSSHRARRGHLATLGTEEDDPHGEIASEVLEAMLRSRSDEQEIS